MSEDAISRSDSRPTKRPNQHERLQMLQEILSSGATVRQAADVLALSTTRVYQLRHKLLWRIRRDHQLSWEGAWDYLYPRLHGVREPDKESRYSGPSVTVERIRQLSAWAEDAREISAAQKEWEQMGLSDLREVLDQGVRPPFLPTIASRWSDSWQIWRMDGWGDWTAEDGSCVGRQGTLDPKGSLGRQLLFSGALSPSDLRNEILVGFPVVYQGAVVSCAEDEHTAENALADIWFDQQALEEGGDENFSLDLPDDLKHVNGISVTVDDPDWQELVSQTKVWLAGRKWERLLGRLGEQAPSDSEGRG